MLGPHTNPLILRRRREMFLQLLLEDGVTYREIAEAYGISNTAVRRAAAMALRRSRYQGHDPIPDILLNLRYLNRALYRP